MSTLRRVAVLVETSRSFGRGVLRGINRFVTEHEPWSMFLEPRELTSSAPPWLATWRGDGILARVFDEKLAQAVLRSRLPVVNLCSALLSVEMPRIESDPLAQARLGFQHFLERGLRHFAFLADPLRLGDWSRKMREAFAAVVGERGFTCHALPAVEAAQALAPSWDDEQRMLGAWSEGLPKPVGVLAADDSRGRQLVDACQRVGLQVPDQVAVMGIENDELVCMMSDPPLSSIVQNADKAGYEAAALLQRMMDGERSPPALIPIAPLGIAVRRSTDTLAHEDALVSAAVRYIREHACDSARIADLSRHLGVSRSTLDRRMSAAIGRSPHEEVLRVRLERARDLLANTQIKLLAVAHKAGFKHMEYMGVVFRKHVGMTPGQYRKTMQYKAQMFSSDD